MTINSRKTKFAELFEHICNADEAKANEMFHTLVVEMARDIHNEMLSVEEGIHDDELDGADMESDLAHDLEAVHGGHEEGHLEADAEEGLADDMLGDEEDDMTVDGDEEIHPGDTQPEPEGEHFEVPADQMMEIETELEKLQAMFAEINGEHGEEVHEGVEMTKVATKMGGEQGGGHYAGTETNVKSPAANADRVKLGGEPIEMGKGAMHTGFERQEPTVKAKDLGKMVNTVKSSKGVLTKVAKTDHGKGEVGKGKSGMPIDTSKDSTIGSKK
jgi:hypothetical protein